MTGGHRSRVPEYLKHILQALERIDRYTDGFDANAFLIDPKTQDAVLRNIEIIGEAARNVERADSSFAAQHPEVPWPVIYAMRNRISHGYFEVDLEIVWKSIQTDLPQRKTHIAKLLKTRSGK